MPEPLQPAILPNLVKRDSGGGTRQWYAEAYPYHRFSTAEDVQEAFRLADAIYPHRVSDLRAAVKLETIRDFLTGAFDLPDVPATHVDRYSAQQLLEELLKLIDN